ncbi:MAG: ATP-binding protein [Bacillota bacterium]
MDPEFIKVLLIEDNIGDARLINEMMSDINNVLCRFDHAFRLSTGLEKLESNSYDVVLLDLGLPDSKGLEALKKVNAAARSLPIIIMTGLEDEALAVEAVKMGAQDYLLKMQIDSYLLLRSIRYAIERKKSEEHLRESEERYHSLFRNNYSTILIIDTETGEIVDANAAACEFYGYSKEELTSRKIAEINCLPEGEIFTKMNLARNYTDNHFFFRHRLASGEVRDVEVYSGPIVLKKKQLLYSIVHDITERKKAEEQVRKYVEELRASKEMLEKNAAEMAELNKKLHETNASKDKFLSIVSHDLKSPFQGLLGLSKALAEEYSTLTESERIRYAAYLSNTTQHLYNLIENMLQWSRIETGKVKFQPIEISAYAEAMYVISLLNGRVVKKNISIVNLIEKELCIYADNEMFNSLLQNLITNAIKFTYTGGTVTISSFSGYFNGIEETGIAISDDGVGISEEQLEDLFRLDVRDSKPGTENEKGTGLGLIICKEIVEKHGGKIWAESQSGKGSTFKFTLPNKVRSQTR